MQNKPNFPHFLPENEDFTEKQSQFKPNFRPISRGAKPNKPNSIRRAGQQGLNL
jgi:hypothetical protein